ncbi:MAG: sugar ABC transporter substrate-binding protein [Planctomycetes bacterium]|nr:sugar ABC transporter substrate-binding protein [Planctomycetota bacterium]
MEREIISNFEKANPDIKIDLSVSSYMQHHEKIQIQLAGGSGPDIWLTDGVYIMEWAERGVLEDLTELYKTSMDEKEYFGIQALRDINERLWGIPKEIETFGLFYNKSIFDGCGIKYPDDTWTWDSLKEAAKVFRKDMNRDSKKSIFGINSGGGIFIANAIYQNGGTLLDKKRRNSLLNTEIAVEAIEYVFWFNKEKCMPTVESKDSVGGDFELFRAERLVMLSGQYCYANTLKHTKPELNYSVAFPPKKAKRTCYYVPNAWVITRGRPKEILDASWKFIQFYSNSESQILLGEKGEGLPFNRKAVEHLMNTDYAKQHNLRVFADMVDQSVDFDVNGCWRQWFAAYGEAIRSAYAGVIPTEKVSEEAHKAIQKVLDAYYKNR